MLSFAIVIPNLNQSRFLPWALESLRVQSRPFHLAMMDGGSTDAFEKAIRPYSNIISHLHSGPDGGQAAAILKGMAAVSGDIVGWLNADDYYFPETLEKVAACFEKDPRLDVVYGDAIHVTEEGFFESYFPAIQEFHPKDLARSCFICQPACFVRRSAYERVGGINPDLQYTMDWDLWCRLAQTGARFQYLYNPLAAVRYYPETKTLSRDLGRYNEIWRIEKVYGERWLPWAWPGFYRFDLACKKQKNLVEVFSLRVLNQVRGLKRHLAAQRAQYGRRPLYGFRPWEMAVEQRCDIHIPWYGRRGWKRLHLQVDPGDMDYRVTIEGAFDQVLRAREGMLSADLPRVRDLHRKLTVSCIGRQYWRLLAFRCDLD